jgi:hypothetical protein
MAEGLKKVFAAKKEQASLSYPAENGAIANKDRMKRMPL